MSVEGTLLERGTKRTRNADVGGQLVSAPGTVRSPVDTNSALGNLSSFDAALYNHHKRGSAEEISRSFPLLPINRIIASQWSDMVRESRSEYLANRLFQSAVDYSIHAVLGDGFKLRRERTVDIPFLTSEREQELGFSWNEYMDVLDWTGENDQSELLQLLLKKLYVDGEFIAEVSYDEMGRKRLVEIDPCRIPPSITPHELPRGNRMGERQGIRPRRKVHRILGHAFAASRTRIHGASFRHADTCVSDSPHLPEAFFQPE